MTRKFADRLDALKPLLRDGQRILEIGCAEGAFGAHVKTLADVDYTGVELSRDANAATKRLDRVFRQPTSKLLAEPFDAVLAYHVLEHTEDVVVELNAWRRLCRDDGWLIVEVPHRAGHPDLAWDHNPEHIHQFTPASLAALLQQAGFDACQISTGHFESPAYPDSLRAYAIPASDTLARRTRLRQRYLAHLRTPFLVRGTGGDFANYLAPIIEDLPIAGLIGEASEIACAALPIERYRVERHRALDVLVCSLRFEPDIIADLVAAGHPRDQIVTLASVLETRL